jgi:phage terminase large subunit
MKGKSKKITPKQIEFARQGIADPVLFARRFLGVQLWQGQVEILESIRTHRKTAVKACHGVGKTFVLAVAVLWWLARYKEGIVLTTSSTFRQVKTQLWSEVHRLVAGAKIPYPDLNQTELKLRSDDNFALGLSTNQASNFQGYHGKHVLIIADEAPGIEQEIWDAIAGVAAGGDVRIVMAGNPTTPSGRFYDAFHRERSLWNCISIDALGSPNLDGITLEELLETDPIEGGLLDQNPFPYLATKRWVFEQYFAWWHGNEQSSPIWMSRIRGQFPDQAQNALMKLSWLERAKERALRNPVVDEGSARLVAGVDVGGGATETVVYLCERNPSQYKIIGMGGWRGEDTRGRVVNFLSPYRSRLSAVRVDAIGVGHNFGLHLKDQGFAVELINVSLPCESKPQADGVDPAERFVNQKAQFYQTLADASERDEIDGLTDDLTFQQLADLQYEIDSRGRQKVESKEKARARGVPSPDRAEALMLALGVRSESVLPPWLREQFAVMRYREGMPIDEIAQRYDTTPTEARTWIQRGSRLPSSPFRRPCVLCGRYIRDNEVYSVSGNDYYHAKCPVD